MGQLGLLTHSITMHNTLNHKLTLTLPPPKLTAATCSIVEPDCMQGAKWKGYHKKWLEGEGKVIEVLRGVGDPLDFCEGGGYGLVLHLCGTVAHGGLRQALPGNKVGVEEHTIPCHGYSIIRVIRPIGI
ncbi:hypothetical protein PIB30_038251 [Stylosanthes scabra]|uniref:Uncharacterized protein n=1 Tax=Stylosanthes scabra TaxID=79078 RepID=A0ABU6VCG0_9FABA|nr:hypothetical protein [Stylosanthes scabra]